MFFNSSFTVSIIARFLICPTHSSKPLHVTFEFGNKLYTVNKHASEEVLADIALVCNQLSVDEFDKRLILNGFLSSTSPELSKFSSSPFSLHIKCSLKPKTIPWNTCPFGLYPNTYVSLIPAYPQCCPRNLCLCIFKQHFLNEKSRTATSFSPQNVVNLWEEVAG